MFRERVPFYEGLPFSRIMKRINSNFLGVIVVTGLLGKVVFSNFYLGF